MIADWYRSHDYHFLALSDHNVLSEGTRWMKVDEVTKRGGEEALEKYVKRFGDDWVETQGTPGTPEYQVRLQPLDRFRKLVEAPGQFIMIQGEEISDTAEGVPVHMNATNLVELIQPLGGRTVAEAIDNNLRAAEEQARRSGREILVHLNHPNFGWAITAEDIASVLRERFIEVYNGHNAINHLGNHRRRQMENIRELAKPVSEEGAGAEVVVDDVFYLEEPFFQDGPVAVAANEVVAEGVTYFSAAGNDNLIDFEGNDIASWETTAFRDAGSCPAAVEAKAGFNAFHCLDFHPGAAVDRTFGFKVKPGSTLLLDLQWDEPRYGVETDLDAFLLNSSGSVIRESSEDNAGDTEMPFELIEWENAGSATRTVQLVVNRFSGDETPRVKFGLIQSGVSAAEYPKLTGSGKK